MPGCVISRKKQNKKKKQDSYIEKDGNKIEVQIKKNTTSIHMEGYSK